MAMLLNAEDIEFLSIGKALLAKEATASALTSSSSLDQHKVITSESRDPTMTIPEFMGISFKTT